MKCGGALGTESAFLALYGVSGLHIDPASGLAFVAKEPLSKLTLQESPARNAGSSGEQDEPGADEPPEALGAIATEHGLPFVEGAPEVRVAPWMTRLTIGTLLLSGMLTKLRPGWGDALELSRENHPLTHFVTYAWIPSHEPAVALADLYCLFLFGAVAEEALGVSGFIGLFVSACAVGGILSLGVGMETVRGVTAAAAALSAYFCLSFPRARVGFRLGLPGRQSPADSWIRLPPLVWLLSWYVMQLTIRLWLMTELPKQRDFTGPAAFWAAGVAVGFFAWLVSKLTSSVQSTT
jgi:hypothetical protein